MTKLEEARLKINSVDKEMAKLFEERMKASEDVAKFKIENGLPIFDKTREAEVIKRNSEYISDPTIREYYINFLNSVMGESKKYQARIMQGMKVAYSGVPGAFAYIAAKKMFPNSELVAYPDFESAYKACEEGNVDATVLPVENSFAGDVGMVMDLVFNGSLYINQMLDLDVVQNLLGVKGATKESIKKVYSHPQALAQSDEYIRSHGYLKFDCANTAIAAMEVANMNDISVGAIASDETAKIYNLEVIDSHINSSNNNTTRFAAFSKVMNKQDSKKKMGEHFILVFTVLNEAGALAKTLNIIGSHGYNMRNLRSRPMKELMWNYYFFVELEGNINSEDGEDMLRQLRTFCDRLKLVGTYNS